MTEFVDTSAFFALLDADDHNRDRARTHLRDVIDGGIGLLTHEYVVVESTALIQRRLGLEALRRFVDDLLPVVEVAWVDEELHREAREALLAAGRRTVSLVDWTSFLVMRRHGVSAFIGQDEHFAREGFSRP